MLTALVDNSNKFRNYNQELASVAPNEPLIPMIRKSFTLHVMLMMFLLEVTIGDIEKLDEVSGDSPESHPGWINWFKFHTVTKCVMAVTKDVCHSSIINHYLITHRSVFSVPIMPSKNHQQFKNGFLVVR